MDADLLHPLPEDEKRRHKLKRLIPSPNSYFMDIKCPGCYSITTAFSHAQSVITCEGCNTVLCTPTGGKCKVTVGCSFHLYSPYYAQVLYWVIVVTLLCSVTLYILAYATDPGIVYPNHVMYEPERCSKCQCNRPARSHHCSYCGRCVKRMDHHCSYLGNCVGIRNEKFFVLFLTVTWPGGWLYVYLFLQYTIGTVSGEKVPDVIGYQVVKVGFYLVGVMHALFIVLVTNLAIAHHILIINNLTTLDFLSGMKPAFIPCLCISKEYVSVDVDTRV